MRILEILALTATLAGLLSCDDDCGGPPVLETEALESMFAIGPKETKAREILSQRVEVTEADGDEDLPAELLLRIYVRITAMQKLLSFSRAGRGLRDIRWRTRLKNAESDLREAVRGLDRVLSEKK